MKHVQYVRYEDDAHRRRRAPGFSLIELLVVISIIALLVSILLPALGKARTAAWQARSMNNIRQILIGTASYRHDFKAYYPITPSYYINRYPPVRGLTQNDIQPIGKHHANWCTWSAWGKNTDGYWGRLTGTAHPSAYDWEAADRPANQYIMDDPGSLYAPPRPNPMPPDSDYRKLERLLFRDPSDQVSYLRPVFSNTNIEGSGASGSFDWFYGKLPAHGPANISAYNDTGTSYQWNSKWFVHKAFRTRLRTGYLGTNELFLDGMSILRDESGYSPSRFVIAHDQYADVVANNVQSPGIRVVNGYGDANKSVMGFGDGHVGYLPVYSGANNVPQAYVNEHYSFVFEFIPARK